MMKIGLQKGTVQVVPYNEEWKALYEHERALIQGILGTLVVDIQHVGSTSVVGMVAKPIIDIAVALESFDDLPVITPMLEKMGWNYRGSVSGAEGQDHLFVKESAPLFRTHHLHVNEYGNDEWNGYLRLREILRTDASARQRYANLKRDGQRKYPNDRKSYTASKEEFIRSLLES